MPLELVAMSAEKFERLSRAQTVFFFPVGPIEDHGPHLPMGLDLVEASALCKNAAEKLEKDMPGWTGVLMPPAPLGLESDTTKFAITVRPHVLRDWLVDSAFALHRMGFKHFVCFSGHLGPKQLTAIEDAGKMIMRLGRWRPGSRPVLVSASSKLVPKGEMQRSLLWPNPTEHGGKADTSVALALCKEQVGDNYRMLLEVPAPTSFLARAWERITRRVQGYWGAPAQGNAEEGARIMTGRLDEVFPKLRAVWEGANANGIFRSWYSVIPPNKSFFKAWLIIFFLFILLIAWMTITLKGVGKL